MSAQAASLFEALEVGLVGFFLVFLRVGAMMALVPAFGERMVPLRLRLALSLAFSVVIAPAVAPDVVGGLGNGTRTAVFVAAEFCSGLALGIALRLFILSLQTAGAIAAQATSLSQLFGGASVEPQPAIAHLFVISALALATMAGLHVRLAELLILSYELFPPGRLPTPSDVAAWGVARIGEAFALAFVLSAPFVIASLVYNLALGAINRAMPQLMVAFVGAPAITLGTMVLLLLGTPLILAEWHRHLLEFITQPWGPR